MADKRDILIGGALRQLREEQQLTQTELADRCHVPQSIISKLEKGERSMYLKECFSYAKALDTEPSILFYRVVRALLDYAKAQA